MRRQDAVGAYTSDKDAAFDGLRNDHDGASPREQSFRVTEPRIMAAIFQCHDGAADQIGPIARGDALGHILRHTAGGGGCRARRERAARQVGSRH